MSASAASALQQETCRSFLVAKKYGHYNLEKGNSPSCGKRKCPHREICKSNGGECPDEE